MDMTADFINKYVENLNNEIFNMKKSDIIKTTQNNILEKTVADLQATVAVLNAKVVELNEKLNKKVQRTSKKKNDQVLKDGGDF